jgi:hypothetical protein
MLTLNQDIELLKQFTVKHKALNSFYFGNEAEADTDVEIVYPFMNAIIQNQSIENGVISRTYLIIISDLVQKDKSNLNHVLSDTERICWDVPLYMRQVSNSGLVGSFKVDMNINVTSDTSRNDDDVASSYFDLTISTPIGNDSCILPINAGNILDANYIYVGGNLPAGNFLVEIKDQDGNVIQTFNTSGEYVVTVLSGIKDTITSNVTTITDDII